MAIEDYTAFPRSRQEANASGSKFFYTGACCKRGHLSKRYAGSGECQQCAIERASRWQEENPERHGVFVKNWEHTNPEARVAINIRWNHEHRDLINQRAAATRAKDPETFRARCRAYYAENREAEIQRCLAYAKANPDKIIANVNRRRAKKLAAEGFYTDEDLIPILDRQAGVCVGCPKDISTKYTVDHYIPLSRGGSNWPANLQLVCRSCNAQKTTLSMEEWLERRGGADLPENIGIVAAIAAHSEVNSQPIVIRERPATGIAGKIWTTNGTENERRFPTDPLPDGWSVGRKPMKKRKKIRFAWARDDKGNLRRLTPGQALPPGWTAGSSKQQPSQPSLLDDLDDAA